MLFKKCEEMEKRVNDQQQEQSNLNKNGYNKRKEMEAFSKPEIPGLNAPDDDSDERNL